MCYISPGVVEEVEEVEELEVVQEEAQEGYLTGWGLHQ
jgi:hypothetical protein